MISNILLTTIIIILRTSNSEERSVLTIKALAGNNTTAVLSHFPHSLNVTAIIYIIDVLPSISLFDRCVYDLCSVIKGCLLLRYCLRYILCVGRDPNSCLVYLIHFIYCFVDLSYRLDATNEIEYFWFIIIST